MNTNITKEIRNKIHEAHSALMDAKLIALENSDLELYFELHELDKPIQKIWDEQHGLSTTEEVGA